MKLTSTILVGLIVGFLKINVVFPFSTGYILQSKVVSPASHVKSLTTSPIIRVPSSTINRFHKHMAVQGSIDDADGSEKTPFFLNPTFQSKLKIIIPVAVVGVLGYLAATSGFSIDISQILESAVTKIEGLGPLGYFYFAGVSVFTCT